MDSEESQVAGGASFAQPAAVPKMNAGKRPGSGSGYGPTAKKARAGGGRGGQGNQGKGEDGEEGDDMFDEEDMNDVTKLAGIDMESEEQNFLQDEVGEEDIEIDQEEDLFLNFEKLKAKVASVARRNGVKQVNGDAVVLMSLALQWRLRTMMEKMVLNNHHRLELCKKQFKKKHNTRDTARQLNLLLKQAVQRHQAHSQAPQRTLRRSTRGQTTQEKGVEESADQARLVNLRDCIACLENDRELAKTEMAYRAYTSLVDDKAGS